MKIYGLVVCVAMVLAAQSATAGSSFCNADPVSMPTSGAATPYPSSITVVGAGTSLTTVDVQLNGFSHTFPDDVDLLLVGPTGAKLVIQSDVGGDPNPSSLSYVISDAGSALLPDAGPLTAGTFKPTNVGSGDVFVAPAPAGPHNEAAPAGSATLTSVFAGSDPNGTWKLFVVDDFAGDPGEFSGGWCLDFATTPVTLQTFDIE